MSPWHTAYATKIDKMVDVEIWKYSLGNWWDLKRWLRVGFGNTVRVIGEVWKDGWMENLKRLLVLLVGFEKIAGVIGGIWKDG